MVQDVLPLDRTIRKVSMYFNNSEMLVGLIFFDDKDSRIYESRYTTGFGSDRKKREIELAEGEVICGIKARS